MATKDKLLANAQKFLSKGQVSKAISEYQKLVEVAPKDVRNRQKLAELLSRDKRNEEALTQYEEVAKHYTDTGFYLKAIAVFKQMQKIEPSRVDIYHRLAELNEKQGLVGNALTEYRNLVAFYDKNEMHHEAIEVLEKMVALDPDNLNFSAKIAESYMAAGLTDEAFERFQTIIEPLSAKAEHVKVVKLYERFMEICPEEGSARLPLAKALIGSGSADKATQLLKGLLKNSPEDQDVQLCLADAYVAAEDYKNARLTLKHLLKQMNGDLDLQEYYVRICIDAGENERARDRLEEWKDAFFQADRVGVLQGFYEELKELLPGDSAVAETLSVIYEAIGETGKLGKLGETKETKEAPSEIETADGALADVVIDDVETLDMVGEDVAPDVEIPPLDTEDAEEELPAEKVAAKGIELDLDLELEVAPQAAEEPEPEPPAVEEPSAIEDEEVEVEIDLGDVGDLDLEFDEEEVSEEVSASTEDVSAVEEEQAEEETPALEEAVADSDSFELDIDLEDVSVDTEEPAVEDIPVAEDISGELELDIDVEPTDAGEALEEAAELDLEPVEALETAEDVSGELELDIDVESADVSEEIEESFDLDLEPVEALETAEEVEDLEQIEELAEVEELETLEDLEEIEDLEALEVVEEVEELEELEELEEVDELTEVEEAGVQSGFAAALNVDAELEEAEFYLQQGLYDDAERVVQTLLEYRPGMPVLEAKLEEINQARQGAEAESEATDFVDIMSDLQDDDLLAATDFLDSFGADTEQEEELSQKTVSELDSADTESHFNLGIAYKEMGLYDDAIVEFEKASLDPVRAVDCITLKGQCHMEAGDTDAAMEAFRSGLQLDGLTDEGWMTLNFELGMLHQLNGQLLEALDCFQQVAEKDSFFRDVGELIKNLRRELNLDDSDDDDGPQGNRDRVSYV